MSESPPICPTCHSGHGHGHGHEKSVTALDIDMYRSSSSSNTNNKSSTISNLNTTLTGFPFDSSFSSVLNTADLLPSPSYRPDMCLDCARACLARLKDKYELVRRKQFKRKRLIENMNIGHSAIVRMRRIIEGAGRLRTRKLAKEMRKATCRVVNADVAEEERREREEREELKKMELEWSNVFDGEVVGMEEAGDLRMELERLFARVADAKVPAEHGSPPVEHQTYLDIALQAERSKDGTECAAERRRKVSFAPDVFDQLDPVLQEPKKKKRRARFRRTSSAYCPGVYAGKAYYDTSGWLRDPDDYERGTDVEYLNWIATPSSYTTPMVILTTELGESRTLVRAELAEEKSVPFVAVIDPKIHILRLVTSAGIKQYVDSFLTRPKPRTRGEMEFERGKFYDAFGMRRVLFWLRGELWIETCYSKKRGGKEVVIDIHSEPYHESVENARRQRELRLMCKWAKKWKACRRGAKEEYRRQLIPCVGR